MLTPGVGMAQFGLRSSARINLAAARNLITRFASPFVPSVAFTREIARSGKRAASIDMALRQSVLDRYTKGSSNVHALKLALCASVNGLE